MTEISISYRRTARVALLGLIRVLLILSLATVSLPAFSGRSGNGNHGRGNNVPPVISGTPPTSVTAGSSYMFQPDATDADGDRLRFSIANMPAWANFSGKTGELSGTPGSADVGTYSNIVISVSDRTTSTSLAAFSIQVEAPAAQVGSVTVYWDPPLARVDGTALLPGEIGGYHIDYGDSVGNYTNTINLADGTATSVTLTDIPTGSYSLVITAYDLDGRESGYSNVSSFSLP